MLLFLEKILPVDFNTEDCDEKGLELIRIFKHPLADFKCKVPEWAYKYVSDSSISGYCTKMFMILDGKYFAKECEIILSKDSLPYDLLATQPKIKIIKDEIIYPRKELKDMLDAFVEGTHLLFITGIA